ncbi:DUF11 domain-containing protein [Candidatus Peregrinibacteria bacterium]|nr:DUF11 domain-containing protein [Candidatus Peregrinibacteria bacterium]
MPPTLFQTAHRGLMIIAVVFLGSAFVWSASHVLVAQTTGTIDLEVTHSGPEVSGPGATVQYGVTVRNLGPATATNVQLEVVIPFVSYQDGTIFAGILQALMDARCSVGKRGRVDLLLCSLGNLPPGQSIQVPFRVRIPENMPCNVDFTRSAKATANEQDGNTANHFYPIKRTFIGQCQHPVRFTFTAPPTEVFTGEMIPMVFRFTQPVASSTVDGPGISVQYPVATVTPRNERFTVTPPHGDDTKNRCMQTTDPPRGVRNCFFHFLTSNQTATYGMDFLVNPQARCGQTIVLSYSGIRASPQTGTPPEDRLYRVPVRIQCRGNEQPAPVCTEDDGGRYTGLRGHVRFAPPNAPARPVAPGGEEKCFVSTNPGYRSIGSCSGVDCFLQETFCAGNNMAAVIDGERYYFGNEVVPCPQGCREGVCTGGTMPPPPPPPPPNPPPPNPPPPTGGSCTDSDGGLVYTQRGSVTAGTRPPSWDQCYTRATQNGRTVYRTAQSCTGSNCIISEKYCSQGRFANRIVNCPRGCTNGACAP